MKDNLRLHLDLLETQLASLEGKAGAQPKFPKTVPLLDRIKKKGQKVSADELRGQISETMQEIVNRKMHYTHTVLKRHLKQFCKVEPLRISKRAKNASDDAKRAVMDAETKVLQNMDIDAVCTEILNRAVTRRFADLDLVPGFTRSTLPTAENNVYARFGKTEAVRTAISQLSETILELYPQAGGADPAKAESEQPLATAEPPKEDDFHSFEPEEEPQEDENANSEVEEGEDPFFEQHVGIANTDDEDDDDGDVPVNYGPMDEQGLPMLTQGYISGSDDDFDQPVEQIRPERKNRRGQRARRKIWEQKFGSRANHILKEEREKQRKQEEKDQKRRAKEQRANMNKRRRVELDSKPLHPSWEAKRKQLELQKSVKFQGKKVSFD